MKVDVYNTEGKKTASADLSKDVFGIEPNDHAIYLDVKRYLAAQRQGTHKSKERAEIQGSTRKIKKQKGTGGARAGSLKNPLFVGGGTIFGPRPRKYDIKLNKKVTKLARKSALAYKAKEDGGNRVVKGLSMDTPKTQELLGTFGKLGLADQKTLVVVPEQSKALYLSSRNLPKHRVMTAGDLSTYDIMNCQNIVFVDNAHEVITGILTA
jgi:large subunit ribosomal protein L4